MADFKDVQKMWAERSVSQFLAVQAELRNKVDNWDNIAARLTSGLIANEEWAKANGLTDGKPKYLTPPRG
jgi:hypothetical protein